MTFTAQATNFTFKGITRTLCRVDDTQWAKFPDHGPLILAVNHVNFIEIPIMITHLLPRPITGFVKAENWENPVLRWIFADLWDGIPLQRGEADVAAMRAGVEALAQGKILAVAPEGRRTGDGRLQQGHPGIVTLALKAQAPILPVAYFGHEYLWPNIRRLRRTDFSLRLGRPFFLDSGGMRVTKEIRRQMVDEIMGQIAKLLPPKNRGYYAAPFPPSETYLRFI